MRLGQKIGFSFLGLLVLLLTAWLALNWRDEAPSAWAQQLSVRPTMPPDADNVYFALFGFLAPPGHAMAEEGQRKVAAYRATLAQRKTPDASFFAQTSVFDPPPSSPDFERLMKDLAPLPGAFELPLSKISWCEPSLRCLQGALAAEDGQTWSALSAKYAELRARYRQLLAQENAVYADPIFYVASTSPLPEFPGIQMARRLLLHDALRESWSGRFAPLLDLLQQDMAFWRRLLGGHSSLISDMVALSNLQQDVAWLSALLSDARFDLNAHEAQLQALLLPLSRQEIDLSPTLQGEFLGVEAMLRESGQLFTRSDSWRARLESLLYKPQATINRQAEATRLYLDLARAPMSQFDARASALGAAMSAALQKGAWCYEVYCLKNPAGQILVAVAAPDYSSYIARAFDLAAYFQMIGVQKELRQRQITAAKIPHWLAQSAQKNPYDAQPFTWNTQTQQLSFSPRGKWRAEVSTPPGASSSLFIDKGNSPPP